MARKVKCLYCKKEGTNDTFYKEVIKGKNRYFCNKTEYELFELNEAKKKEGNVLIDWVMIDIYGYKSGMVYPKTLKDRIKKLLEFYPCHVVKEAFNRNYEVLTWAIKNKDFANEFGMTCYVMTIVEGSVNDIYLEFKRNQKQNEEKLKNIDSIDIELFDEVTDVIINNKIHKKEGIYKFLTEDDL